MSTGRGARLREGQAGWLPQASSGSFQEILLKKKLRHGQQADFSA
jgi:hypothetical protein